MIQFPKINGSYQTQSGHFRIPGELSADLGDFHAYCLEAFAQRTGLLSAGKAPWLILRRDATLPAEAYRLLVTPETVRIFASSEPGIIHGLTTLYLAQENGRIPCCEMTDAPKYPHRGQSLDPVRHFFGPDEIKKIIEQMALVKMNVFHFHLSDDQGWRIESKRFPALHQTGKDFYTQDQLREIVEFARVRGIEVIPEIDLPGHTSAILAAYPELGCTGKRPDLATAGGIYTTILCARQERVYDFLEALLDEICPIFPSRRFHIGGDEAPKGQWSRCPHCRRKLQELGSDNFEDLQSHFTRRIADMLKGHGKTGVCWNESLKGSPLPSDIQIQYWTSDCAEPMISFAETGGKFLYSSMFDLYFDYPYSMTGVRKLYRRKPKIGAKTCESYPGFLGLESAIWTEHIDTAQCLEAHLFPRLYIVAEKAWSGGHKAYPAFLSDLEKLCALARKSGITPMPRDQWDPTGPSRQQEALDFFQKMNGGVLEDAPQENQESVNPNIRFMIDYVTSFFRLSDLPKLAKLYFK